MTQIMPDGALLIEKVNLKIGKLEELIDRYDTKISNCVNPGTLGYMKQERAALKAGLAALRYHRAEVEGVGDILGALRRLVNAMEVGSGVEDARYDAANVLRDWMDT